MAEVNWCFTCGISSDEETIHNDICSRCYESFTGKPRETFTEMPVVHKLGPNGGFSLEDGTPMEQPPVEMPTEFTSFEEMQKFLNTHGKKPAAKAKAPTPKMDREQVYQEIHFYLRPKDTWQALLRDAVEEKGSRNTNIEVQAHRHLYGDECNKSCRRIDLKEGK